MTMKRASFIPGQGGVLGLRTPGRGWFAKTLASDVTHLSSIKSPPPDKSNSPRFISLHLN